MFVILLTISALYKSFTYLLIYFYNLFQWAIWRGIWTDQYDV